MRTFYAAARILALGSLVLAVLALATATRAAAPVVVAAHATLSDALVIAQGPLDLNPSPSHPPPGDGPGEHGDEDSETDEVPDTSACDAPRFGLSTDAGTATPFGPANDGERTAKLRALERPPRPAHV